MKSIHPRRLIYFGSDDKNIYALHPDGTKKWVFMTGGPIRSSPAIGFQGTIYVGSNDHKVYAINQDGSKKWEFTTGNMVISSPAVRLYSSRGEFKHVYIGSNDHNIYALRGENGELIWEFATNGKIESSPTLDAVGRLFIGSADKALYVLPGDYDGGSIIKKYVTNSPISSSPVVTSDNTLYFGTHDHTLYAYYYQSGGLAEGSPWPKFRHDLRNTGRKKDLSSISNRNVKSPKEYSLENAFPNPFNPSTTISFTLPRPEHTTLTIYNILGAEVGKLVSDKLRAGSHKYIFDGSKLASGVYYYQVTAGEFQDVKKMILLR